MLDIIFKGTAVWLMMVVAAILNGVLRDNFFSSVIGGGLSLPLSGIILSLLIFFIAYMSVPFFKKITAIEYWLLGMFWVTLTLLFEYGFGYFIAGRSWQEINQVFNVAGGNLFVMVLIVTAASPWVSAKIRGRL